MKLNGKLLILFLLLGGQINPNKDADARKILELYPTDDTYIMSALPDATRGTSSDLVIGNAKDWRDRILLRFNISSIPITERIIQSDLYLYCWGYIGTSASRFVDVYRMGWSWSENEATWNNSSNYYSTPSYYGTYTGGDGGWKKWRVTDLVREWHKGTYWNYGMMLIPNPEKVEGTNMLYHYSKESKVVNGTPTLIKNRGTQKKSGEKIGGHNTKIKIGGHNTN
ncbi:MAG: DNRLRE domain-containing protein [bacterium]